jgi:hypothetical protein
LKSEYIGKTDDAGLREIGLRDEEVMIPMAKHQKKQRNTPQEPKKSGHFGGPSGVIAKVVAIIATILTLLERAAALWDRL